MTSFSQRSRRDLRPNAFSRALAAARAGAEPLLDLSCANPTELGLGWSAEELLPLLSTSGAARYEPEPFGLRSARVSVAALLERELGCVVPPERIMLSASTSEAYGFLLKLLCDPGDSVLVPVPSYPLLEVLAGLEGVRLLPYRLAYDGDWHLDRASVERALEARTRAIVCIHPNNPTGCFLERDELKLLASFGLPIVSDEVFGDYALRAKPGRAVSALEAATHSLVFRLSGLSKSLALPQLKLAFTAIAGPEAEACEACARLEHIADAYLSPATPVQLALPRLLARGPDVRARILGRVRRNRVELERRLSDSAASALRCEGGWYAIVRLPALYSDETWCVRLLAEKQLVVQPGYFFDLEEAHVVLSLITPEASFADGVARLRAHVDALTHP